MLTLAPFGLRPAYHISGHARARVYAIANAYATAIFKGDPVILNATGTVIAGTAAADLLGVFHGVEYVDATGKPTESNFWPAAQSTQSGSEIRAYIWDDPNTRFIIQANGSVPATAIGNQADVVIGTGNTLTGLSTTAMSASLAGVGVQAQLRIEDFDRDPANTAGDAFTSVVVQIARHQMVANKVAI